MQATDMSINFSLLTCVYEGFPQCRVGRQMFCWGNAVVSFVSDIATKEGSK